MRSGTHFMIQARNGSKDACETFYFAGANAYYLVGKNVIVTCPTRECTLPKQATVPSCGLHCHYPC